MVFVQLLSIIISLTVLLRELPSSCHFVYQLSSWLLEVVLIQALAGLFRSFKQVKIKALCWHVCTKYNEVLPCVWFLKTSHVHKAYLQPWKQYNNYPTLKQQHTQKTSIAKLRKKRVDRTYCKGSDLTYFRVFILEEQSRVMHWNTSAVLALSIINWVSDPYYFCYHIKASFACSRKPDWSAVVLSTSPCGLR